MRALVSSIVFASVLAFAPRAAAMSCQIVSVMGVGFGAYDTLSSQPLDSVGAIVVRCDGVGAMDQIAIDIGRGTSSTFAPRTLTSGLAQLAYNLFLDAARTLVWGDGTSGTSQLGPLQPPDGVEVSHPVYGRIPAGQNVPCGSYGDVVTVTVNY